MAGFEGLLALSDADGGRRGRQFERLVAWWLCHDPRYSSLVRRVWLWGEWPGRWGVDAGIDLVAETVDGGLWAVQAKAYAAEYSVTKRDVDSFLSESARLEFSYRLLVATTNRISTTARRTLDAQAHPVGLVMRSDLVRAEVVWPESPEDLRAPQPERKRPRLHQREAVEAVVAGFAASERGQLVMACGTGKTLVGLFVAEALGCQRVLVLVPSLSLLAQTLREWTANAAEPFRFLPVCSDESVVGEDHLVAHTSELGVPVTTDPAAIAGFVEGGGRRVVFCTYQSAPRVAEAFRSAGLAGFDLAVADEAHRVAGPRSGEFATVLDGSAIPAERRLFMTATPRYFTGWVRRAGLQADLEVASMDDPALFGPVFHSLTFGEAISRDLLSDYRVVIVGVDDPTVHRYVEEGRLVTRDGREVTDARTLAAHVAVAKAMRDYGLRRTISFHSRVAKARRFAADFPDMVAWMPPEERPTGKVSADFMSGEMPSGQRDVRLDRLRHLDPGERGLLANARCLAEGVDVPNLDGVAFIDPRSSPVDVIQAVGRAIRKSDDKTVGSFFLPVFISPSDDPDQAIDTSAFKPLGDVLRALRAHDGRLAEELDQIRREVGRHGVGAARLPTVVSVDMPVGVGEDFLAALTVRLVEHSTATWDFYLGLLEGFAEREGHADVAAKHVERGWPLGNWVSTQRQFRRKGILSDARQQALEAIPTWDWTPLESAWAEGYARLQGFAAREGHCRVPPRSVENGFELGHWVDRQRTDHKRGRLGADREAMLEGLPGWTWNPWADNWEAAFSALSSYVSREHHANPPATHVESQVRLGAWVTRQRAGYEAGLLSEGRSRRLEGLPGWTWNALETQWETAFDQLVVFTRREGHARPPAGHIEGGLRLGSWVVTQRTQRDRMSEDRRQRLEALPGWAWDSRAARWSEAFDVLQRYVRREGHARVPQSHLEEGFKLGAWVGRQRWYRSAGQLEEPRLRQLQALPGWTWNSRERLQDPDAEHPSVG